MLTIAGIDVFRGETQVLWGIDLTVAAGERVSILGSNGAGKSSLMAAITGMLTPRKGDIRLRDQSLVGLKPHRITQMGVLSTGRRLHARMNKSFFSSDTDCSSTSIGLA